MSGDHVTRHPPHSGRPGAARKRSTSTTPPCATAASRKACRSPSTTSCGSPSNSTISVSSTSRAAGREPTPRTRSSSAGPRPVSSTCSTPPWWRSARPARPAAGPRPTRCSPTCSAAQTGGGVPGRQVGRVARHRDPAHHADRGHRHGGRLGRLPGGAGPAGVPRRRAFLRRLPGTTPASASTCCGRPPRAGAEVLVLCDTNGGTLPFEVERVVGEVRDRGRRQPRLPFPQRLRLRGRQLPRGRPAWACTQVQGCINGYGERTGNADL